MKVKRSFDLQSQLLPAPRQGGFRMDDYWVWDGSIVQGEDGRYHLFASRWPKAYQMHPGWLFKSEIVRASADTIEGPYQYEEVVLGPRDKFFFDGRMTHNPSIRKVGDTYLLYYIGVTYGADLPEDPAAMPDMDMETGNAWTWEVWLRKRIGLATSKSIFGPWERRDEPILLPRQGKWDRGTTSNPSPFVMPDGSIYLAYKSSYVTHGLHLHPFNLGIARAESWDVPFERVTDEPALDLPEGCFVEDPFLWHEDGCFHLIMKDLKGDVVDHGCGLYAWSEDAKHWELGDPPAAYTRDLVWDDGKTETVGNFERPQLLFAEDGRKTHMIGATAHSAGGLHQVTDSWITVVPLKD